MPGGTGLNSQEIEMTARSLSATEQARITEGLEAFLKTRLPDAGNLHISAFSSPGGGLGFSNVTCFFDLDWQAPDGQPRKRRLVLRCPPRAEPLFPDYCLAKQFRIPVELKAHGIPVPEPLWLEEDPAIIGTPFFLMERLDGAVLPDMPSYHTAGPYYDALPQTREKMWFGLVDVMARIHNIEWKSLDMDVLVTPRDGRHGIELQLDYWENYLAWLKAAAGYPFPVLESALAWLRGNLYVPEYLALCWGDARVGNVLYGADCSVAGVLDWEMAFFGDPEADLAWCLFLDWETWGGAGIDPLPGHPGKEATIRRYEAQTGRKVKNLFFNEVLAGFKHGLIMATIFRRPEMTRLLPTGVDPNELALNNIASLRLKSLLNL